MKPAPKILDAKELVRLPIAHCQTCAHWYKQELEALSDKIPSNMSVQEYLKFPAKNIHFMVLKEVQDRLKKNKDLPADQMRIPQFTVACFGGMHGIPKELVCYKCSQDNINIMRATLLSHLQLLTRTIKKFIYVALSFDIVIFRGVKGALCIDFKNLMEILEPNCDYLNRFKFVSILEIKEEQHQPLPKIMEGKKKINNFKLGDEQLMLVVRLKNGIHNWVFADSTPL